MNSPLEPTVLFQIGPVPITQAIVTTWAIMTILVIGAFALTRRLDLRPTRRQAALELMETHLGPDEQTTLNCCNNLGTLYLRQGRLADADVLLVRSYEGRRRKLGREHPDTVSTMGNLSALRRVQGRYEEALELLLEAEEILKAGGGRDETQIWTVSNNLAFVLERLGRKEEALERFEQLVTARG